jgi:hypothetical protein
MIVCGSTETAAITTEKRPYQILLAEDSAADVGIVRIALEQDLEYVLHIVSDGEQAVEFIEKTNDSTAPGPDREILTGEGPSPSRLAEGGGKA